MDKKDRRTCGLAVAAVWVLLAAHHTAAQGSNCRHSECVPLRDCPGLQPLLRNPTREGIKRLQEATCFVRNRNPHVCCPASPTSNPNPTPTPRPNPTPTPRPNTGSELLPKVCGQSSVFSKIIGGAEAPLDAYPWKAVLGYSEIGVAGLDFACGGSLINERYVLTAAHCILQSLLGPRRLQVVRLGEWDLRTEEDCDTTRGGDTYCAPPAQDYAPVEVLPHPGFHTRARWSDDIGLIRLDRPVDFQASAGYISPVCLPAAGIAPRAAVPASGAIAAGWGITEDNISAPRIKHVRLPYVETARCNETYRRTILESQMCMGGEAGQDSCSGDSGGPLVVSGQRGPPFVQVGIVSYGPKDCGVKGIPGVYTSVSHYRNWIELNMKP